MIKKAIILSGSLVIIRYLISWLKFFCLFSVFFFNHLKLLFKFHFKVFIILTPNNAKYISHFNFPFPLSRICLFALLQGESLFSTTHRVHRLLLKGATYCC